MTSAQSRLISSDRDGFEAVVRDPCHVRRFLDDAVPREDIEHMVGLAMCAASACNSQAWRFIAIQDRELIAAMQAAVLERFEQLALRPGLALQEQKRMVAARRPCSSPRRRSASRCWRLPPFTDGRAHESWPASARRSTIVCARDRSCRAPGRRCSC